VLHPLEPEETLRTLLVAPGAVSSSGIRERSFSLGGTEYGHIIDPRSGRPASAVKGVTVWTETAILGDVLSTALFVLGRGAIAKDGPVERLVRAWQPPEARSGGAVPRASILIVEDDPAVWGGLGVHLFHLGEPAIEVAAEG